MKKLLIGFILGLVSTMSMAAATDCRQLVEDGEVDCVKATSWFAINPTRMFSTFEEAVSDYESYGFCTTYQYGVCYTQYDGSPAEPPEGRTGVGLGGAVPYTYMDYGNIQNNAGWIVLTHYKTDPTKGDITVYSKQQYVAFHFRICPSNTQSINILESSVAQRYCKPDTLIQNSPTSCDTCNAGSGNSSIGN